LILHLSFYSQTLSPAVSRQATPAVRYNIKKKAPRCLFVPIPIQNLDPFGLRTCFPGIESVVPGEELLSHSDCAGLCQHISLPCHAAALLLFLQRENTNFQMFKHDWYSYLCVGFTQCQANRSLNRKGLKTWKQNRTKKINFLHKKFILTYYIQR